MDLAEAIDTLYSVSPGEFVATRTALARESRAAKQRDVAAAIAALRKPSVAAWALNALARRDPDVLTRLADVGERLRSAQSRLDAAALTALRPERDAALEEVIGATVRVAEDSDVPLSAGVRDEIRATGVAALADADAHAAVASGHLTRALSYAGFGEVDLDDAVVRIPAGESAPESPSQDDSAADPGHGPAVTPAPDDTEPQAVRAEQAAQAAAAQARRAAREDLDRAERELADARLAAAEAERAATSADGRVAELEQLLTRARADAEDAQAHATTAVHTAAEAADAVTVARQTLESVVRDR